MLFVTFGLLFGLGTLLWCLALSITQALRGDRDIRHPWHARILEAEEPRSSADADYQAERAA